MGLSTSAIVSVSPVRGKDAARYGVALVCAASAGVHAALAPDHYHEGGLGLGGSFVLAAVALAVAAALISSPQFDRWAPAVAVLVLAGVALAYVLSRTSGIPHLIPEAESADPLGLATSTAEVAAALVAATLRIPIRKDQL